MVSSSCACSSCCNEFSRHLVLPFPPEDEDTTHADFRASLFESLGLEITSIDHALLPPKEHGGPLQCQTQNLHSDEQLRLLRVCSCLCDCCIRVSCGAWLDALRVNDASDSELYFFQGHLQAISKAQSREADDTGSWANKGKAAKCLQCAEGRTNGKREEAWGLLAGCAGPFSFRHCLAKMQKPPEMLLFRGRYKREGHTGVADSAAARYAKQGTRLFSLFCAPANVVRPSTPDEQKTAILRASASELGAYIHPSVQVATFEREGRGILAADKLHQGDLLLRMPATTLVNVYTALTHPTFSLLAQVLLGLPADQLQQSMEGIGVSPTSHEHQRHQQTTTQELQSLVDCDVVVCIFLLFLAFAAGQEGGKALLRFLPPANADDAACTAKALCPSRAAAAAAAAEKEALLLSDPEDVLKFLGDEALADAMHRSIAKCSMMQHQLLPLLHQAFPPPPDTPQIGVLATCRAAAAAAAGKTTRVLNGFASGAVAAAADVGADTIAPLGSPLNKKDLLCAFVGQLNYSDFLWAHLVLESRSFSLRLLPQAPLTEIGSGPNEGPPKDSEEGQQDTEEDTEEELTVPFLPELCDVPPMNEACSIFLPVKVNGEAPSRFHVRIPRRCASLVPLGELLNHHPHGQVLSPSMEEEGRWLCLRLACDVPMGAQLFAHYGPLQSWQFLGYFGFCPSSFPHLEPPPQLLQQWHQQNPQEAAAGSEWLFSGETRGNPVDFLSLQIEISSDDAELELKKELMQLQDLPFYGIFCTGAEVIPWKFLASLFVSSHPSLDRFIAEGTTGDTKTPAAAAAAAGENAWGPAYTFAALQNDPAAAQKARAIISEVLQSVAEAAQRRITKLDEWEVGVETGPTWTHTWGDRLRVFLQNQVALATRQMAALNRIIPLTNKDSGSPTPLGS